MRNISHSFAGRSNDYLRPVVFRSSLLLCLSCSLKSLPPLPPSSWHEWSGLCLSDRSDSSSRRDSSGPTQDQEEDTVCAIWIKIDHDNKLVTNYQIMKAYTIDGDYDPTKRAINFRQTFLVALDPSNSASPTHLVPAVTPSNRRGNNQTLARDFSGVITV